MAKKKSHEKINTGNVDLKLMTEIVAYQCHVEFDIVNKIIRELLFQFSDCLKKGRKIEFRRYLILGVKKSNERVAQNPKTLEPVTIPSRYQIYFKPGKLLRPDNLND